MSRYLEVWLDHHAVGCGWRRYVDLTGPRMKDAVLFYVPTLTQIRVPKEELRGAREVELTKGERKKLRGLIVRTCKDRKRLGLKVPDAQAKAAFDALAA